MPGSNLTTFVDWPPNMKSVAPPSHIPVNLANELLRLRSSKMAFHIAILREPFISAVIDGTKTIESRFSQKRIVPWQAINKGEAILFAKPGGIVVGYAKVLSVHFLTMSGTTKKLIEDKYGDRIGTYLDQDFWSMRSRCKYATLVEYDSFMQCTPIRFVKRDQRAWVRLEY